MNVDSAVPPECKTGFRVPQQHVIPLNREESSELIFIKNTTISLQNGGENKSENYWHSRTNLNH